ncbi:Variant-specific surface protein, partial [Giardia duodenalis]
VLVSAEPAFREGQRCNSPYEVSDLLMARPVSSIVDSQGCQLSRRVLQCQYGPGSGVCREARDGACVWHAEENKTDRTSTEVIRAGAGDTCPKVSDSSTQTTGMCKMDKCDVTIGGNPYCSQCSKNDDHLVDGKCVDANTDTTNACTPKSRTADGTCESCAQGYFLHRGGCYQFGGAVGKLICTDPSTSDGSPAAGACTTCALGYFKNPTAAGAAVPPCIACNDTAGFTVSNSAIYKGVANCAACTAPQAGGSGGTATCTACVDGKYGNTCATDCNSSCKSCTGAEPTTCTSCKPDTNPYFKKGDGETGECVAEDACTSTHFPTTTTDGKKICTLCSDAANGGIADCQECSKSGEAVTCSACTTEGKKPNADGAKCVDCTTAGCAKCSDDGVCLQCSADKYLTPTAQCVDDCGKLGGYYADGQRVCQPCSLECAACVDANANQCSACPAGKVLQYTTEGTPANGGSCVNECKAGAGGCETCGAVIGGSRYCSKCGNASQAPLNGNCAANVRTAFCDTITAGVCTQCASRLQRAVYWPPCLPGSEWQAARMCAAEANAADMCKARGRSVQGRRDSSYSCCHG